MSAHFTLTDDTQTQLGLAADYPTVLAAFHGSDAPPVQGHVYLVGRHGDIEVVIGGTPDQLAEALWSAYVALETPSAVEGALQATDDAIAQMATPGVTVTPAVLTAEQRVRLEALDG
jgi:hypothetical protein